MNRLAWIALGAFSALVGMDAEARACGCFAPPSPATPVVQAGERILFSHEGGNVVAYIQLQYQGAAADFGWLVPLPSVPTVEVGSDELFQQLGTRTAPQFQLTTRSLQCGGGEVDATSSAGGCGGFGGNDSKYVPGNSYAAADAAAGAAYDMGSPLVEKSSIGPYDFAVLKADDSTAMFQWLSDNRYYVPSGTMNVVAPYIHPGAYFLALKLRSGESSGDVQPIVLRYASDLPIIPIILTSVGAVPDMGIEVYLLGESRGIPRNYRHVVPDELPVWLGQNYNNALVRAVHQAPLKHAFATEYAGSSSVMQGVLFPPGRFGDLAVLRTLGDAGEYLRYLQQNGYRFDATLLGILAKYIPEPDALVKEGVPLASYYQSYDYYSRQAGNFVDGGAPPTFDPVGCTSEIQMRVVDPIKQTSALFDVHPYLTRLYTALSPEDMTADPVFSENPDLPDVPRLRTATVTQPCRGQSWIETDQGLVAQFPTVLPATLPPALRIETLREAGPPIVDTDNTDATKTAIGPVNMDTSTGSSPSGSLAPSSSGRGCACNVSGRSRLDATLLLAVAGLALGLRRRRRAA